MLIFTRVRKNTFLVLSLALVTSTLTFSRGDSRCCRSLANSSLLMISRSRIGFTSPANAMLKEWKMQTITQNTGDQIWDFQIRKIIANFFIKVFQRIPKSYPRHGWHRRRRKHDTSGRGHRRQRRATGTRCPGLDPRRRLKSNNSEIFDQENLFQGYVKWRKKSQQDRALSFESVLFIYSSKSCVEEEHPLEMHFFLNFRKE